MSLSGRNATAFIDACALQARTGHVGALKADLAPTPYRNRTSMAMRYRPDGFWDQVGYSERVALYWKRLPNERSSSGGAISATRQESRFALQQRVISALLSTLRRTE